MIFTIISFSNHKSVLIWIFLTYFSQNVSQQIKCSKFLAILYYVDIKELCKNVSVALLPSFALENKVILIKNVIYIYV